MKIEYQELATKRGTLRGLLTTPDSESKNIIVMFHGYTGHKNENGFLFKQITKRCVEIGYATLRFDFYGSGDSDGEFSDMTFLTEVEDGRQIIEYAYRLNSNKPIILLGFSMGGAVAGFLSYEYQEKIEKLILLSPAGCMDMLANNTFKTYDDSVDKVDLGGYYVSKAFVDSFNGINLYNNVDKFLKPVLVVHGEKDMSVPIEYGRKYAKMYPHSMFYVINGSPHCYTKVEYRREVQDHIINFLK